MNRKRRRAIQAQADDVADRLNEYGPGRPDGAKRRPRRPLGNSRAAILRRLRHGHPQLYELVLSGQISPFRAAIAAGFRKSPGPRPKRLSDPTEEGRSEILLELWLGPGHNGSLFADADELRQAWTRHRAEVMRMWGSHCRRPQGWWEFEAGDLERPDDYDDEPRVLFEHDLLSEEERQEYLRSADGKNRQQKEEPPSVITEGSESV
jgi:hypothetical protein